ncbi:MARVEL domain-containing protein [Trichonephila inaurata madagascariensis]|uniref:MARVEL domain-containing protein n=1 Tax=Trichonephila inaurata madagascariensis TaxID=2747483 RepID=A0A8X6MJ93_9ARAC|nr:MARVEL domain-containing protein [Trichonephila inaurata madagascariensis]
MQHAVSVKVPGCCSYIGSKLRTNLLDFNLPFLQSIPGAFKIAHTVLGMICLVVLSYFTASFLPKTAFELTYHVIACIMYLSASLILLCEVVSSNAESDDFKEPGYEGKIAASALGLANSVLYGVSSFFSFQARKQMG